MLKKEAYAVGASANAFDEMLDADGNPRAPYRALAAWLAAQNGSDIRQKQQEADTMFRRLGITFAVYGDAAASERLIPFDMIPRVRALNAFLYEPD